MKRIKSTICIILLVFTSVMRFGGASAAAGDLFRDARILPDGKGSFYIFIKEDKSCKLYLCGKTSDISQISCEGFAAEEAFFDNDTLYLTRYAGHTLCIFDVLHKETALIDCLPVQYGFIAASDMTFYYCDDINSGRVKAYKGNFRNEPELNAGESVLGLFSDPRDETVYAAVNSGVIETGSGRRINCIVPDFPVAYNDGVFTDTAGDMYSFDGSSGFTLLYETDGGHACYADGYAYCEKSGVIVRTEIESGAEAVFDTEKEIIRLSASGSSVAAFTDSEVIFIRDEDFSLENEESDGSSESKVDVPKNKESSKEITKDSSKESSKDSSKETSRENSRDSSKETEKPQKSEKEASESETGAYELTFDFSGGFVKGIPSGTSVSAFRKLMKNTLQIRFRNESGKVVDKGSIGTGWSIEITGGRGTNAYTAVVIGDVNGNGAINTADADMVSKYLCELCELSEAQRYAADMNRDGTIDIRDVCRFQEVYFSNGRTIPQDAFV